MAGKWSESLEPDLVGPKILYEKRLMLHFGVKFDLISLLGVLLVVLRYTKLILSLNEFSLWKPLLSELFGIENVTLFATKDQYYSKYLLGYWDRWFCLEMSCNASTIFIFELSQAQKV